ncbi:MAG: hypothetical protein J6P37_03460 [Lachnospiraceae bacterium]|nr:hypothetical protein [Lachnospiraceae bacterium]
MEKKIGDEVFSISRVLKVILILAGLLIIGACAFFGFRVRIMANNSFRDAKNVYMALSAVEIEYYSRGESIYDPTRYDGLAEGVAERVRLLAGNEGTYRIVSYDAKKHQLTGLIYNNDNIYVTYNLVDGESVWEVKYIMHLYSYTENAYR